MSRILVTGGAGFIGHRVVALLAARGQQVAVLDNLSVGMPMPHGRNIRAYHTDLRDAAALDSILTDFTPDSMIHLAALHHIPTCEKQPKLARDINIQGTQTLLDAAANHGITHFLLASSAAVYDWVDAPLVEDSTPLKATDVYSSCKLANEQQAADWATQTGGRVSIARIFNVIGHDDPNGHIIPDILKQIPPGARSAVIQLGNTMPRRDYTHADDTAAGLVALLDHLPKHTGIEAYNISAGVEYSVADLVAAMGAYLDFDLTITTDPARIRKIDRLHLLGDPRKMRQATGWRAEYDFHTALARILSQLVPDTALVAG